MRRYMQTIAPLGAPLEVPGVIVAVSVIQVQGSALVTPGAAQSQAAILVVWEPGPDFVWPEASPEGPSAADLS